MSQTLYEQLGGASKLRDIIDGFVDRLFADRVIGFFFKHVPKERLKELEFQHAASFLGAEVAYQGRALEAAHQRHPIQGGHFSRRQQILKEVLEDKKVAPAIQTAWLAYNESQRLKVTGTSDPGCEPSA